MKEYFTRLRKFWFQDWNAFLWLLIAIPGLLFFQIWVHEGTHAVVALMKTGSFPTVAPYPHLTKGGNFFNGVTLRDDSTSETHTERISCDESIAPVSRPRLAGWIGWPQIVALLLVAGFIPIFLFLNITNAFFGFLWRAWFLGASIDFMANTAKALVCICDSTQDWSKVMIRGDIGTTTFAFLTWFLWLVPLSHFVWVWWSKWGTKPLAKRNFWDYRWLAFILAILSAFATVFALAVKDPDIDYGSFPYVANLMGQIAAALACTAYFIVVTFTEWGKSRVRRVM